MGAGSLHPLRTIGGVVCTFFLRLLLFPRQGEYEHPRVSRPCRSDADYE